MKKILLLTIVILFSAFNNYVNAQEKIKEGKIKFEISYPDSGDLAGMLAMMPKTMDVYFKNGDTRTDMKTGMGDMSIIRYEKSGDMYTLMDMMGQKMAMKMSKDMMNKMKDSLKLEKPVITMTDETKTIATYKCRKEVVTMAYKGEKQSYEVWITKDIDNVDMGDYSLPGIDGFAMEFNISEKGMTLHMLCTSVEKYSVPDSLFKIPDDYKVTNIDDMMKDMGKPH